MKDGWEAWRERIREGWGKGREGHVNRGPGMTEHSFGKETRVVRDHRGGKGRRLRRTRGMAEAAATLVDWRCKKFTRVESNL